MKVTNSQIASATAFIYQEELGMLEGVFTMPDTEYRKTITIPLSDEVRSTFNRMFEKTRQEIEANTTYGLDEEKFNASSN